jgi:hypothetical protein
MLDKEGKTMKKIKKIGLLAAALAGVLFFSCDMVSLNQLDALAQTDAPPTGTAPEEKTPEEEAHEAEGHYLKLLNMPLNTQISNISSASVFNSAAGIAKYDNKGDVRIFTHTSSSTVYIPLVYNSGQEFVENGTFYISLAVYIDALTWINVALTDNVLVDFADGRGTLDVLTLPKGTISDGWPASPPGGSTGDETKTPEEVKYEAEGHYIKLVNMPLNTQISNITSASVFNSVNSIAKYDNKGDVRIFTHTSASTVYIPLVYNSGQEFVETGRFYVGAIVYIDALTWINVALTDNVLVDFADGRGTLDVLTLPKGTISDGWPVSPPGGTGGGTGGGGSGSNTPEEIAKKIDEIEKNGHYLKLYHLPLNVIPENFSAVAIWDSSQIARIDTVSEILIAPDGIYSNAYIPLVSQSGNAFTRSGSFFTVFTVQVDALTRISVQLAHRVVVEFVEGRGTLDITKLVANPPVIPGSPPIVETQPGPEQTENEDKITQIIASGGYIRFFNLPVNVSKNSFSKVSVLNNGKSVANVSNYDAITVRKGLFTSEAFVPLVRGAATFSETGSFQSAFSIIIDAITKTVVDANFAALYAFTDGHTDIDVTRAPSAPAPVPHVPHNLVIAGLPDTVSAPNILDVFVHNQQGVVAKCPDYTQITFISHNGKLAAVIPLVYDNNKTFNGLDFAASGDYIVSFTIFTDALHVINVTIENNCILTFSNGSSSVDVADIPAIPRNCLTIANLPANTQHLNISDVYIWNQAGKIAACVDYSLLEIVNSGGKTLVRIPLAYQASKLIFTETGPFYVTFDLNIDALTRITMVASDKLVVNFIGGNGTLDASNLPQALPPPYLTIMGLPKNTAKGNFTEVFLYNVAGKVAKCPDYTQIIISKNNDTASAMIPLVYNDNAKEYFRDSGSFVVSFTVNVDINTQIIKARTDSLAVTFTDGSGELNLARDFGFFSGGLRNPDDTSPPVIKSGTVFEMNGGYVKLTADTAVNTASFPSTCVVYVYAVKTVGVVHFEYSATAPVYSSAKHGYYSGERRALFKMVYIKDTVTQYAAKKYIADDWQHFDHYTIDNVAIGNIADKIILSLSGTANPAMQTNSFTPGWYVAMLKGAGGGGGTGIDGQEDRDRGGGVGGSGGYIAELVYLSANTSLRLFTGSGGKGGQGNIDYGWNQGNGAGGGGSGTFVYNAGGYFLCAGGGGGAAGRAANACTGGTGGAGGSLGSGGGGGAGGADAGRFGSGGGAGGGYNGGSAGGSNSGGGGNGSNPLNLNVQFGYQGGRYETADDGGDNGGAGGNAAYTEFAAPDDWQNTNGANGQGGASGRFEGQPGGTGGNNRNSTRGNGANGGAGGGASDNPADSAGKPGSAGSINLYKIN